MVPLSSGAKKGLLAGGAVLVLAGGAFAMLAARDEGGLPLIGGEPVTCPLTGLEPANEARVERPAVAVKIENSVAARPLSGLEDAEVVFEELVEGGVTRFMALYHCTDARKAGPVRSARVVDPSIMVPLTRILAFSGANQPVKEALADAGVVTIDESSADDAVFRVDRPGVSSEHTLYASTPKLRRIGARSYDEPPPDDVFSFGESPVKGRRARTVTVVFSAASTVVWQWSDGSWLRFEGSDPAMAESGEQLVATNVLIEEHDVDLSDDIVDSAGNPSVEISDVTGSGRAVLFRDGRAIAGRWVREELEGPVRFETRSGEEMVFAPGTLWIELVPSDRGEVKGSFSYER